MSNLAANLQVYLPLKALESGQFRDQTANGNHATLRGAPQVVADGVFGSAVKLNGIADCIILPARTVPAGNELTVSFWAFGGPSQPRNASAFEVVDANGRRIVNVHIPWGDGLVFFDCGNIGTDYDRLIKQAGPEVYKGRWRHWAFTKNAATDEMKIYLDGQLWHTGPGRRTITTPAQVTLGAACANRDYYEGTLRHLRIHSRALPATAIRQLMHLDRPLVIRTAVWAGTDGRSREVVPLLPATVDRLEVRASNNLFSDPAPWVPKTLRVDYAYQGVERSKAVAEEAMLVIDGSDVPLVIQSASYGNANSSLDVTDVVRSKYDGASLSILASNDLFGDPAPFQGKSLTVNFTSFGVAGSKTVPEGGTLQIREKPLLIQKATYFTDTGVSRDVTTLVQGMCDGTTLDLTVSNDKLGGDPAMWVPKKLRVDYVCGGITGTRTAGELVRLTISANEVAPSRPATIVPAPTPVTPLQIQKAIYGSDGFGSFDVTAKVRSASTGTTLSILASNNVFGDPAMWHHKKLRVYYTNKGVAGVKMAVEEAMLTIAATDPVAAAPLPLTTAPAAPRPAPAPLSPVVPVETATLLRGINTDICFVPFSLPIQFEGEVKAQQFDRAISYSGPVTLTAPFSLRAESLEASIGSGSSWALKFALPSSPTIGAIVSDRVLGNVPSVIRPLFEALVMPYLRVFNDGVVILANGDGEDETYGAYVRGFNVFTKLKFSQIPPFDKLATAFPAFKSATDAFPPVVLGVGTSKGVDAKFFVGAHLEINSDLIPGVLVLDSASVNVTVEKQEASTGAEVAFRLKLGSDTLKLRGGVTAETEAVKLWGALDATNGEWNPFGIKGISIVGMGVEVGPPASIAVRGEARIAGGVLGGTIALSIDGKNSLLVISKPDGIGLVTLLNGVLGKWLDLSKVLDVQLKDLNLYLAPAGGTIAGQTYEKGLRVSGALDLWGIKGSVNGQLEETAGGTLKGNLDPIVFKAGGITIVQISDATDASKGAAVDLALTPSKVGGTVSGKVAIFGLFNRAASGSLTSDGFSMTLDIGGFLGQQVSVRFASGTFYLAYGESVGTSVTILGTTVGITVGYQLSVKVSASSFTQAISFRFSAMGQSYQAGPYEVPIPFTSKDDIARFFQEKVKDFIVGGLLGSLKEAGEAAFRFVCDNVTNDMYSAIGFFKKAGADVAAIGTGMRTVWGATQDGFAWGLKEINATTDEIGRGLKLGYGAAADTAAGVLRNARYAVDQVGGTLKNTYYLAAPAAALALKSAGYAAGEVCTAMNHVYILQADAAAAALKGAGYAVGEVGGALKSTFGLSANAAAVALKGAAYAVGEVGSALKSAYGATANTAAAALRGAGYAANETASALQSAYGLTGNAVGSALSAAGYAADQVGNWLSGVGGTIAGWFGG